MSGHHDGQELVRRLARQRPVAATAVIAVATVNYRGVTRTARLTRLVVTLVLVVLAVVVVACLGGGQADLGRLTPLLGEHGRHGILQSAGLLFFAFAGYARIATMGEEVRDPGRTPSLARSSGRSRARCSRARWPCTSPSRSGLVAEGLACRPGSVPG